MGIRVVGAATLAALFLGAPSAGAAIVGVTYTGTVSAGFDQIGLFGSPNSDLTGDSYQVTYTFNTMIGTYFSTPTESSASGGTSVGTASPSLGVTVTINGVSVSSNLNGYFDQIYGYNDGSSSSEQYHSTSYSNVTPDGKNALNYATNYVYAASLALPASILTPYNYDVQANDNQAGTISFSTSDNSGAQTLDAWASANITNVAETLISPGPNPGAGLAGLAALVVAGLYVRARHA